MADNVSITAGSGTSIATDEIGGVHYPRGKVGWGADGAYDDVSTAHPLPVSDAGGSLTVDGAVTVTGPVAVTGPLTDAELRASAVPVAEAPAASGGLSKFRRVATADTNAASVKGAAGQLYGYALFNVAAAARTVKLYDKSTSPTVGTDTPALTFVLPAGGGANVAIPFGVAFDTGIALSVTANAGDADTTAVAAGDVIVNLFYK